MIRRSRECLELGEPRTGGLMDNSVGFWDPSLKHVRKEAFTKWYVIDMSKQFIRRRRPAYLSTSSIQVHHDCYFNGFHHRRDIDLLRGSLQC